MRSQSFLEYFVEQESYATFLFLALASALYVGLLAALAVVLRRWIPASAVKPVVAATGITLLTFALTLTLFEGGALYYRHDPPGSGVLRQGEALDRFYRWFEIVFFSLYGALVVVAFAAGWFLARRLPDRRFAAAVASGVAVVGFFGLTLPMVEFANACSVGRPLVTDRYSEC